MRPNTTAFEDKLKAANGTLWMTFISLYDGDSYSATFDVTGAARAFEALPCFD